jgi:hypothetical protein
VIGISDLFAHNKRYTTGGFSDQSGRLLQSIDNFPVNGTCTFEEVMFCKMDSILDMVFVESRNGMGVPSKQNP